MADLILPSSDPIGRFLLGWVKGKKPPIKLKPKQVVGLESFWFIGGPAGQTYSSSYGTHPARLADYFFKRNLHGYNADGSNEPQLIGTPYGIGVGKTTGASYCTLFNRDIPKPLQTTDGTFVVCAYVRNKASNAMLIGSANYGQTPLRNYGQGIHIDADGYIYGFRSSNNPNNYARVPTPDGELITAAFSASGTTGILSVNGISAAGTIASSGYSYDFAIGECGHSFSSLVDRKSVDGAIFGAAYFNRALDASQLDRITADFWGELTQPVNDAPFLISVPAGGGTPTLSSPGVINVLSDRATPQVTLTF